jgi:predicted nucleic acid-binding protein
VVLFLGSIIVADAEKAARLRINLRTRGRQLEAIDSMLAIIALENNLTLLTRDKDFQALPGLKQENWYV